MLRPSHPPVTATEPAEPRVVRIEIIRRRLQEQPDDIPATVHSYPNVFKTREGAREGKIPNEPDELARYKSLLDFLEQMAAGLVRRIKRLIPQRSRRWFYSARSLRSLIGSKSGHTNGL
jgi:hypothetical protein